MGVLRRSRSTEPSERIDLERYQAAAAVADEVRVRIDAGQPPVAEAAAPTVTLVRGEVQALPPIPAEVARCEPDDELALPPAGSLWPLSPGEALLAQEHTDVVAPAGVDWQAWEQRWRPLGPALVVVTSHRLVRLGAGRQENLWWPQVAAAWTGPTLRQLVVLDGGTLWRLRGDELPPVATIVPWALRASAAATATEPAAVTPLAYPHGVPSPSTTI